MDKLVNCRASNSTPSNQNSKLLTTLATALIGAITGFLLHREKNSRLEPGDLRQAIAAWTLAALSLYFGYLTSRQLAWMLQAQSFNLFHSTVLWLGRVLSSGRSFCRRFCSPISSIEASKREQANEA